MSGKVWVIEVGAYADRQVSAVTTTKEKALELAQKTHGNARNVVFYFAEDGDLEIADEPVGSCNVTITELAAALKDAERWRCILTMLWWRTDPFAQDIGNMSTGYWQTKLFKKIAGKPDVVAAIDAAIASAPTQAREGE